MVALTRRSRWTEKKRQRVKWDIAGLEIALTELDPTITHFTHKLIRRRDGTIRFTFEARNDRAAVTP